MTTHVVGAKRLTQQRYDIDTLAESKQQQTHLLLSFKHSEVGVVLDEAGPRAVLGDASSSQRLQQSFYGIHICGLCLSDPFIEVC